MLWRTGGNTDIGSECHPKGGNGRSWYVRQLVAELTLWADVPAFASIELIEGPFAKIAIICLTQQGGICY
jgi:hypothetical protein